MVAWAWLRWLREVDTPVVTPTQRREWLKLEEKAQERDRLRPGVDFVAIRYTPRGCKSTSSATS